MTKYRFTLILKGPLKLTEEIADELFAAGCDDGTPGTCNGVFSMNNAALFPDACGRGQLEPTNFTNRCAHQNGR